MERKIGEIFEFGGEWYQCVEGAGCYQCAFNRDENTCTADNPHCTCRSDKKEVVFKKLKKIEEPVTVIGRTFQKFTNSDSCVGCVFCNENNGCDKCCYMDESCLDNEIWIEIKQNKEAMEEKKQKIDDLVGLYSSGKITYKELNKELKALYDKEESEPTLKEFDIEAAKSGKPVCTRDGRKARIICFDAKDNLPIIALITNARGDESLARYKSNGRFINLNESDCDLMMLHKKKEGWVNVYKERCYETREEAIRHIAPGTKYVNTIRVEWEE